MRGLCGRQVLEFVGLQRLHELSSGIEPDRDGRDELLVLQWWTVFSRVGSESL